MKQYFLSTVDITLSCQNIIHIIFTHKHLKKAKICLFKHDVQVKGLKTSEESPKVQF